MVKVVVVLQPAFVAVTVIVAVMGLVPELAAVNVGIGLLDPLKPKPIDVLEFDQE